MRTVNATLTSALSAGTGKPVIRGNIGYDTGAALHTQELVSYKLSAAELEFEMAYATATELIGDQTHIWIERGLSIAGTEYTVTSGRFFLRSQRYTAEGHQIARGSLFPKSYYSAAGDVSNYTPLNTSQFNDILSSADNNLQAAMNTLDDHAHPHVIMAQGADAVVGAGATVYAAPAYSGLAAAELRTPYPLSGILSNLIVRLDSAQPGTGSLVITLRVAGSDRGVVVTIPAGSGAATYTDNGATFGFTAGQAISFKVVNNAAANSGKVGGITIQHDP